MPENKQYTLCIVHTPDRVLLGLKKRGLGQGKWNGFGGKVERGESVLEAAIRECREEAGIIPANATKTGELFFTGQGARDSRVHVFSASVFSGQPQETEEMMPRWFHQSCIPYQAMWPDDAYWLPLLLRGQLFSGHFTFSSDGSLLRHALRVVSAYGA